MCKITEITETRYICPYCGYQHKSMEHAEICVKWHDEHENVSAHFNDLDLCWYVLKSKNSNEITHTIPYKITIDDAEYWGWRGTCLERGWRIYDVNYSQYYSQKNWQITQIASLKQMWESERLLPCMRNIISGGSECRLNEHQKKVLYDFWNNDVLEPIEEQIYKNKQSGCIEGLLKIAVNNVARNYFYSNMDKVPEFNELIKGMMEHNYRLGE